MKNRPVAVVSMVWSLAACPKDYPRDGVRLQVIPSAGHLINVEWPAVFRAALVQFLS